MKGKRQKEKKFKWMKVLYTARRKKEGPLQNARYELYPKITMEGRWLEELGFHVGDSILLEYGDGCIKISPAEGWMEGAMVCEPSDGYDSRENMEAPDGKGV